jgi:type I restriction enzyme S subunit
VTDTSQKKLGSSWRIADCLTSLDNRITAETQKLEALKTHKKGLMQQLFPYPEEALP